MSIIDDFVEKPRKKSNRIIFPAVIFLLSIFIIFGFWVYDEIYKDQVYQGVKIGGFNIGGLSRLELVELIENLNNRYAKEGIDLSLSRGDGILFAGDKSSGEQLLKINTVGPGESAVEMIRLDSEALSLAAMKVGRSGSASENFFKPFLFLFNPVNLSVPVVINRPVLEANLKNSLSAYEDKVRDAAIANINVYNQSAEIIPERSGQVFDPKIVIEQINNNLAKLSFESIQVTPSAFSPAIVGNDIRAALPKLWPMLQVGAFTLVANPSPSSTMSWQIPPDALANLVEVRREPDDGIDFFLNPEKVADYLNLKVLPSVEVPAKDAIFTTENNKVKDFVPSTIGMTIDLEAAYSGLNENFRARSRPALRSPSEGGGTATDTIMIILKPVLPKVQISNSNDLGIVELVGAGTSTFRDSHTNRIKNIANAVKRLNGTLIKPGEVFSANKYAGPYTSSNGFLPEQIIRGRKIEEAVGGGMCQIGTTLFRMAMNTGLDIT
ncbi:MAG: VanW family protein, partial [Patescibacteria group bacterium]